MAVYAGALLERRSVKGIKATDYLQFMSHTVAANLAQFFEVRGRVVTACSACTSARRASATATRRSATGARR
jgi:3-oxoacyl-[acyl-carrier-protein] synthase II